MKLWTVLLAAASGYLVGSLSFARIVMRLVAPSREHRNVQREVAGSDAGFESDSISATAVGEQLGRRYGCLTALLDIGKGALVALVFRLWLPGQPYFMIAATTAILGHNYPAYYRFQGGRGLSTMYGGFLVLDWVGVILTTLAGLVSGILLEQVVLIRWLGVLLMIPWIWFRTRDPFKLGYVVFANLLFWTAMIPELRQAAAFSSADRALDSAKIADVMAWAVCGEWRAGIVCPAC